MKIKNFLILIGPPGSGKGTQGKLLAGVLDYTYLSLGATLREYAKRDTREAMQVKESIDNGHIIPDDIIRHIFHETITLIKPSNGLILDGFPRDVHQISILDEGIGKYRVDRVRAAFIDLPKAQVIKRLAERRGIEARADDTPDVIHTRFREYDEKTHPLVDYFDRQHKLVRINGDQSIERVHADLVRKLTHE